MVEGERGGRRDKWKKRERERERDREREREKVGRSER